ncbi:MAG: tRNA (adenosine(37)-N6)-threonylcarbamoyltransferase complex dimerization subunit type 1 TsaB [Rubrivivax sp.]|nr:tRNA (adenosine(37)-N6)-threonylcarbamoyltransferase complex dimerization subunit type 1 TsaB [Rubrivivax sp.]
MSSAPPRSPALLAFDTSTEQLLIAATGPAGDVTWAGPGGAVASAQLVPRLTAVLAQAGLALADLDAIAFGAGPGAFTGLRTACAVAQGLAFGLAKPVLPLDSLQRLAEGSPWRDGPVWVAMDARMDEVYAAEYQPVAEGWRVLRAPALYTLAALAGLWTAAPPRAVAGSAVAAFRERLPWRDADLLSTETAPAAALLRVASQAWAAGLALPAEQALPLYLRDKVAQTTAERQARAQALAVQAAA